MNRLEFNKMNYEQQLEAVNKSGYALGYVQEQTEEICLAAVNKSGYALAYVQEQTEEICLAAVKQDGYALKYVQEQTEEICLAAVKQDGLALQYVEDQTDEICLAAVNKSGYALAYVQEQTEELCLEAVKQNGYALGYVQEQTEEICLEAVKQNGYALQYVKDQTEEICLAAVKENFDALQYVENQTEELCLEAVKQDGYVLDFVNPDFLKDDLEELDYTDPISNLKTSTLTSPFSDILFTVGDDCNYSDISDIKKPNILDTYRYSVSGNIGLGKSTLCDGLTKMFDDTVCNKEHINYPLLEAFYIRMQDLDDIDFSKLEHWTEAECRKIHSAPKSEIEIAHQHLFMANNITRDHVSKFKNSKRVINDRPNVENVLIFAKQVLDPLDYYTYLGYFSKMHKDLNIPKDDICFILQCEADENYRRVEQRGRSQEDNLDKDYHKKLGEMYNTTFPEEMKEWAKNVVVIDTTNMTAEEVLNRTSQIIWWYETTGKIQQ